MRFIPKNKADIDACRELSQASEIEVSRCIPELLEWLQDINWPVAIPIIDRLKDLDTVLIDPIKEILNGSDSVWKYCVIVHLLSKVDREVVSKLESDILVLINEPTMEDVSEEVNLAAMELLISL